MTRLIRAEAAKLLTTRLWWGMLLGALAFTALEVVVLLAGNGHRDSAFPALSSAAGQRTLLGAAQNAYIFSLVVGVIAMTTEFRHFTTRPTFLGMPRRGRVIAAKLVVVAALSAVYGVMATACELAIALPWLGADHITLNWGPNSLVWVMVAAIVVVTLYGIFGLGVGCVIRNQVAAVIVALVYLLVLEPLVGGLGRIWSWVGDIYQFLPAAAASAVTQTSRDAQLLEPWEGGLALLAWGILLAAVGWIGIVARDIP